MKKNNLPELRFSTFDEVWNQHKLGDLCDEFRSGKSIKAKDIQNEAGYPVLGGNGLRGYTNTYNHDGVYALIGRQGALCGNMNISYGKAYFTEHAIAVKGNENNDTRFLFYLLDKMNLGQYSGQSAQPGLAVNKLVELTAFTPVRAEQIKIGDFFKRIDETISLQQQELDTLKQTKQGFLQKMFPKEGADMPEVRFAGFSGEWRETSLSEVLSIPEKNIVLEPEREKLLTVKLHCNGIHQNKNTATLQIGSTNYYKRKSGQFIYGKQNFFNGAFGIIPDQYDGFLTSSDIPALEINYEKVSSSYLLYFMSRKNFYKKTESISTGTGSKRIHESTLLKIEIPIPPLEEQNQIGNFFKQIDELIALQQQELDALKQTKKAFLQKMFV